LKGNLFIKADTSGGEQENKKEGLEKVKKIEIKDTLKANIFIKADSSGDQPQTDEEKKSKKKKFL